MKNITQIVLPNQPQFDPLAAYYLLMKYGEEKFPGVKKATMSVWPYAEDPTATQKQEWEQNGIVAIDVGGGSFDHHTKQGKTATELVAEALGIAKNPEIQTLLEYAWEDDQHGLHNKYGELPYIIKALYKAGKEVGAVVTVALSLLDVLQEKERHWHIEAKEEWKKAQVVTVKGEKKYRVGLIESNDVDVSNYARQMEGMDVVLQRNAAGYTYLFTNKASHVSLKSIVIAVRTRELTLRNTPPERMPGDIGKSGKHPLVPEWYYHPALNALMNGSFAVRETPATKIPWDAMQKIVLDGLGKMRG